MEHYFRERAPRPRAPQCSMFRGKNIISTPRAPCGDVSSNFAFAPGRKQVPAPAFEVMVSSSSGVGASEPKKKNENRAPSARYSSGGRRMLLNFSPPTSLSLFLCFFLGGSRPLLVCRCSLFAEENALCCLPFDAALLRQTPCDVLYLGQHRASERPCYFVHSVPVPCVASASTTQGTSKVCGAGRRKQRKVPTSIRTRTDSHHIFHSRREGTRELSLSLCRARALSLCTVDEHDDDEDDDKQRGSLVALQKKKRKIPQNRTRTQNPIREKNKTERRTAA